MTRVYRADKSGVIVLSHCLDRNEDVRAFRKAAGEPVVPIWTEVDKQLGVVRVSKDLEGYDIIVQIKLSHYEWESIGV